MKPDRILSNLVESVDATNTDGSYITFVPMKFGNHKMNLLKFLANVTEGCSVTNAYLYLFKCYV